MIIQFSLDTLTGAWRYERNILRLGYLRQEPWKPYIGAWTTRLGVFVLYKHVGSPLEGMHLLNIHATINRRPRSSHPPICTELLLHCPRQNWQFEGFWIEADTHG